MGLVHANAETRKIFGTITKCGSDDIVITNALISAESVDYPSTTNTKGEYEITNLFPGFYDITFFKTTYREKTVEVFLSSDNDLQLDMCLCPDIDFNFITESYIPPVQQGDYEWWTIEVEGGCAPYEFSLEGELPEGLSLDPETGVISGTVAENKDNKGHFYFTIKVLESGFIHRKEYLIEVFEIMKFETPSPLKSVMIDYPFRRIIRVSGGKRPYSFEVISGSLPNGVTLTKSGILQGTPVEFGESTFVIQVKDANDSTCKKEYELRVVEPLIIETEKIGVIIVGEVFNQKLVATGGVGRPYKWEIASDEIPENMVLDKDSGVFSGIPQSPQKLVITFMVQDADDHIAEKNFTLWIVNPLTIETSVLDPGRLNDEYSGRIQITGGVPPFFYSCSENLPKNLSLDPLTGIITGIATEANIINLTIEVTDSSYPEPQRDEERVTISIKKDFLIISGNVLPEAIQNVSLNDINDYMINVGGGTSPYTFRIIDGALPPGIEINAGQSVELIGTPTVNGIFTFTIEVTDLNGKVTQKTFFITVKPQMTIVTTAIKKAAEIYKPYNEALIAIDGTPPYTWEITGGKLPDGLQLNHENDIWSIQGTPIEGTNPYSKVTFMVTDNHPTYPCIEYVSLQITVIDNNLTIKTLQLSERKVGMDYKDIIEGGMGVIPYTWTLIKGTLPPGLNWVEDLQSVCIEGKAEKAGIFPFCIKLSDHNEYSEPVSKCLTITIHNRIFIGTESFIEASRQVAFSEAIHITNTDDTVTCSITGGNLPEGLELDPQACVISGTPTEESTSESFCIKAEKPGVFGSFDERCFSIIIAEDEDLIIKTGSMIKNMQFQKYEWEIDAYGGIMPYHWFISNGYLPRGLTYYRKDNVLKFDGSPTQCGLFEFDVKVMDSSPIRKSESKHFLLEIVCAGGDHDTTRPEPPELSMSYPEIGDDYSNGIITVILRPGYDEESGISGYSYEWNTQRTCNVDNTVETVDTKIVSPLLPNGDNLYLHVASVDNAGNASITLDIGPFKVTHPDGHILIVGAGEPTDPFWNITKVLTVNAYKDFRAMGYRDEQIDFHIQSQMISIDIDETPDDIVDDPMPTVNAIIKAITSAENYVDVSNRYILYLQGHGTTDARIRISGMDFYITAQEIDVALDILQSLTNCQVIVIVEACFSGSFIEPLKGERRVIITSTDDNPYNTDSQGRIAFSRYMLAKLREKKTLRDSFDYAKMCMVNMGFPEPQMDDTFDGVSDADDAMDNGYADNITMDVNGSFVEKPVFKSIDVRNDISSGYQADVTMYDGAVDLNSPLMLLISPNKISEGNTFVEFPEIVLESIEGDTHYQCLIDDLPAGVYKLVINVANELGESADPIIHTLRVNSKNGDVNNDNSVDLKDAITALRVVAGFEEPQTEPSSSLSPFKQIGIIDAIFVMTKLSQEIQVQ